MSDLLNQASLVMIPSGYKEDTVFSQLPQDGSGDLAFTRASNGTRVNSAGLVEDCPWNLVQYSEDFSNAAWQKTNSPTMTYNIATAPNGTTTADGIQDTTGGSYKSVNQLRTGITANSTFTYSIYVKKETTQTNFGGISVFYSGGTTKVVYGIFNPINGTINFANSTLTPTSQIVDAGDYWRIIVTTTDTGSNTQVLAEYYATLSTNGTTLGQGIGSVRTIWGAQLNIGSTAKPYFPTTDRLNVPRLTYQNGGGGCPSLLLEKQSTNLLTYSEDFTNAAYSKQEITVTANASTAPDGTNTATRVTPTTVTGTHQISRTLVSIAQHTISVFVKANGYNTIEILDFGTGSNGATFDVSAGTVTNKGTGTGTITNFGNGWYRCTATCLTTGIRFYIPTSSGTFTGNGTSGLFIWGAQMEASSYPTSYIPTTSASATRVADACSKTGISSLIGQTQGTIFVDFQLNQAPSDANGRLLQLWATNDTTNAIIPIINQSRQLQITTFGSNIGSPIISAGPSTLLGLGQNKIAVAYTSTSVVVYRNGVLFASGDPTLFFPASLTSLDLGGSSFATRNLDNPINQAALFKTRLTNAELASITTI